jgi:acetyltransferase-like isoleucine patch superfamily enzyme
MSGVRIGADAILGAHAVATRDIPDRAIFGGVPAKQLKSKDDIVKGSEPAS